MMAGCWAMQPIQQWDLGIVNSWTENGVQPCGVTNRGVILEAGKDTTESLSSLHDGYGIPDAHPTQVLYLSATGSKFTAETPFKTHGEIKLHAPGVATVLGKSQHSGFDAAV
jgi:hypothetical protein